MAKVVSTKYGDRRLVYLPPISLSGVKTANVDTIEPAKGSPRHYRYGDEEGRISKQSQIVPKQYAYREKGRQREQRQAWLGSPTNAIGEGNLVNENEKESVGDVIFRQLYQQASTKTLQNYTKGQYPVLPPVSGDPHYMQYTNQGMATMMQQQEPSFPTQKVQPTPTLPAPPVTSNPNEKHIYYGPNGEVLPGPPSPQRLPVMPDFAFEGLLKRGRLVSVSIVDGQQGFPKVPDILLRDFVEKYGQYEETVVRVVARRGQFYVHATPNLPGYSPRAAYSPVPVGQAPVVPEYVPVYLEEGEEFDFDKFMRDYQYGNYQKGNYPVQNPYQYPRQPQRRYRTPLFVDRNNDIPSRDRRLYSPDITPSVYDPISHLRWQKDDRRWTSESRRIVHNRRKMTEDRRQTAPDSGRFTFNRSKGRNDIYTADDIKPVESLRPRR